MKTLWKYFHCTIFVLQHFTRKKRLKVLPNLTLAGLESVSTNITEVTNSQPAQILPVICGSVRIVTSNIRDRQAGWHFLDCSGDFRASKSAVVTRYSSYFSTAKVSKGF